MPDHDHFAAMAKKSLQVRRSKSLERHILLVLASAPPLTDQQRADLAAILRPTA